VSLTRIAFEITRRCNLNCKHCLRDETEEQKDLDLGLIEKVMRQGRDGYGVNLTAFTGGEPFMYPDLEKLFELTADMGYTFSIVTNGHFVPKKMGLLNDPRFNKIINHIAVSLDGPDPETHDSIRGTGAFKKAVAAIVALKANGFKVHVKYTLGKHNIDKIEQAILEISHLEVEGLEMAHTHPTPDNMASGLMPAPGEMRKAESIVYRMAKEMKMPVSMTAGIYVPQVFSTCASINMTEMYVDVMGRLCLCCQLPGIKGMDHDKPERDVAANLYEEDLWDAHNKLISVITGLHRDRIKKIANGEIKETDMFQCIACARYFGKADWINDYPENPWAQKKRPDQGG
jgi:MoaA/NifB/PqqE/SkfB family radical SAM enzyme